MDQISIKIRRLREFRNYSQDYLAESLNVSQQTYSRLERQASKMTLQRLQKIAEILECDLTKLLLLPVSTFEEEICYESVDKARPMAKIQVPNINLRDRIESLEQDLQDLKLHLRAPRKNQSYL